jgi:tetratricopeptide (TPR) repeat protein
MARTSEYLAPVRGDPALSVALEPPGGMAPTSPAASRNTTPEEKADASRPIPAEQLTSGTIELDAVNPRRSTQTAKAVWDGATKLFLAIPSIVKTLSFLLGTVFAALIAYSEFSGQRVVIEPFEVASDLRDGGFTSRAVANKLTDHLATIRNTARTSMRRQQFVPPSSEAPPKVLALGGDVSVDAAFQYIREFLGREPVRIVGEIVTTRQARDDPPVVHVTTRVKGRPPKTISGPISMLDSMLLESAEHIFLHTQPYLLASYLYEVDPKRSFQAIQYVLQNEPATDDARAFNLWGLLLLNAGDPVGAVERFREAVRVSNESDIRARAYTNWAAALYRQAQYDEAIRVVQKALEADAAQADAYHIWGLVLAATDGRATTPATPSRAAEQFKRAIEVNPRFIPAYFSLAQELERGNALPAAIEQLRKAVDLDRGSAEGHIRLGRALLRARELTEAQQHLDRAVELNPKSFDAWNALGIISMQQGDFKAAAGHFARAIELSPREGAPHYNLGLIHRMGGDRERAIRAFQEYVALSPEGSGADQARSFIAELRGKPPAPR